MSLDYSRITTAAKSALVGHGMKPDDVPFGSTGKGALELIIDEIAKAVINEITSNAVVTTGLDIGLNSVFTAGVPAPPDGGTALQTAWKAATIGGIADGATGGVA